METKDIPKAIGELHGFLEDKDIFWPESIFLLRCYMAWVELTVKEKELEDE